ncbi:hypothetical protein [Neisseria polysaccharea]|uniref:Uncharacterized protein n=1 Tax=Neisseria polysaccharea TaxID=489 RepID=A0ABV1JL02_NEIPO
MSLVFGAFLLDLLCCHTTLSANQRLTAGTYTAEFDYDVVGTLAAARYDEVDILYKLPDRIGNIYPDRFGKEATYERGGRRKEDKEWTYHFCADKGKIPHCFSFFNIRRDTGGT